MTVQRYLGFSTAPGNKNFSLTGVELINRDLQNHIDTVKGEIPGMPGFGTRIPLMAFQPADELSLQVIEEDLRAVADYDPRVELIDLAVFALPDNNAIVAMMDLRYIELNTYDTLRVSFKVQS